MSNLSEKIKQIMEGNSPTSVPGTGKSLVDSSDELSGAAKTGKLEKDYDKGTKAGKLSKPAEGGSTDEKATSETAKIRKNQDTSSMQKLKAESFEALFNGEELTEDFKLKAEAIFEASVAQVAEARLEEALVAIQEEHENELNEAVEAIKGELVEQIDGYLDYVVEQWMQDNAIALESGIKVEMVSSFMENMKKVFEDHYIDVPESKLDVVEEQAAQISVLEDELISLKEEADAAKVESQILKCEAIIKDASNGLTVMEADKLKSLAENVDFDTEEEFSTKVNALKESFFRKSVKQPQISENSQEESQPLDESATRHDDVAAVLRVLQQQDGIKLIRSSN